ncbi:peptide chain release factor 2 [Striga asiatica]|uniref:Peptide chain release factor 2 n=1 Tax=Striga asiatica TaxID=4170 RepID=A0A5A7P0I1_STRAF|nr:peptide chain release factor 2 [Striga asiatica]
MTGAELIKLCNAKYIHLIQNSAEAREFHINLARQKIFCSEEVYRKFEVPKKARDIGQITIFNQAKQSYYQISDLDLLHDLDRVRQYNNQNQFSVQGAKILQLSFLPKTTSSNHRAERDSSFRERSANTQNLIIIFWMNLRGQLGSWDQNYNSRILRCSLVKLLLVAPPPAGPPKEYIEHLVIFVERPRRRTARGGRRRVWKLKSAGWGEKKESGSGYRLLSLGMKKVFFPGQQMRGNRSVESYEWWGVSPSSALRRLEKQNRRKVNRKSHKEEDTRKDILYPPLKKAAGQVSSFRRANQSITHFPRNAIPNSFLR